jgi:CubicO group peptidase (beta-lactamase class C family)
MVASAIAYLAAADRLALSDPLAARVPELRRSTWAGRVTVGDLLANRSGLPLREESEFGFAGRRDDGVAAVSRLAADVAAALEADKAPGEAVWSYTNVGWCLLGRVIEAVTDLPWPDAMSVCLTPVGLHDTSFGPAASDVPRVTGHEVSGQGVTPVSPTESRAYGPAGTTTLSTVDDLLAFAVTHLEDPSLAFLRVPQALVRIHGWLDGWCLGWAWFDWGSVGAWGWDGLLEGERSFLRMLPDRRAAVVLLTNGSTGRAMYRTVVVEVMEQMFGVHVPPLLLTPSPGAAGDLSRFAGTYAWPDRRIHVGVAGDRLVLSDHRPDTPALPVAPGVFLTAPGDSDNPTITFGSDRPGGRPHVLYRMLWGFPRVDE